MAIIERLKVSGGFLDGLDVKFASGLNVIIGPRGAGKTSVIELIRFCLGSATLTERLTTTTLNQAQAILSTGVVQVTLRDGLETLEISRSVGDDAPRLSKWLRPFILAQNEIEAIGLESATRLALIDGFEPHVDGARDDNEVQLRTLQAEISSIRQELASISDVLEDFVKIDEQLGELQAQMRLLLEHHKALREVQNELQSGEKRLSGVEARAEATAEANQHIAALALSLVKAKSETSYLTRVSDLLGDEAIKLSIAELLSLLTAAGSVGDRVSKQLEKVGTSLSGERRVLREQIQPLRAQLDSASKELSATSKQIAALEDRAKERDRLIRRRAELALRLDALSTQRGQTLVGLRLKIGQTTTRRNEIAADLNSQLAPRIRIEVLQAGSLGDYVSRLTDAFRGSGLHSSTLAPQLARHISPEELVVFVERDEATGLAKAARIPVDRAKRILQVLSEANLADILTSKIDDDISLELLDGIDYKDTASLSTGQRCTVVLPILLCREAAPLILDQPEDHLDNAFVVETLVQTVLARKTAMQLIFTTHNANIPVLGNAEMVLHLESDGRRGYVKTAGALDTPEVVASITSIMEGGREAFDRRAKFYATF